MVKKQGSSQGICGTNSCHQRWCDKPNRKFWAILSQSVSTAHLQATASFKVWNQRFDTVLPYSLAKTLSTMTGSDLRHAPPMNLYRSTKMWIPVKSIPLHKRCSSVHYNLPIRDTEGVIHLPLARTHDRNLNKLLQGPEKEELYIINLTGLLSLSI